MSSSADKPYQKDLLARIAEQLGCDVSDFMLGARTQDDLSDVAELLRLWLALPSSESRRELLEHARRLASN